MPKTKISEYSATANSNTDVASINIDEGCAPSGINNAIRAIMGHLKDFQSGTSNDPFTVGSSGSLTLSYGTANGVAYLNGSKVVTTGSALTFDGTNLGLSNSAAAAVVKIDGSGRYKQFETYSSGTRQFYIGWDNTSQVANITNDNNYPILFSITGTEQMRLTSTGLGLGTTAPYSNAAFASLSIGGSSSSKTGLIALVTAAGADSAHIDVYNSQLRISTNGTTNPIGFYTGGGVSQNMTLDASGNLLVGDTSAYSGSRLSVKTGNNNGTTHAWYAKNSSATVLGYQRDDGLFNTGAATNSPYNFTTASAANLFVDSSGTFYRSTSSLKYKTDVQDATHGLAEVLSLRPVTYRGKNDGETIFGGLIAEEVDAAGLTEFVQYAEDGTPDALAYGNMVSLCIKAIQQQQAIIQSLTARITALESA